MNAHDEHHVDPIDAGDVDVFLHVPRRRASSIASSSASIAPSSDFGCSVSKSFYSDTTALAWGSIQTRLEV